MQKLETVRAFVRNVNAFHTEEALALFSHNAVIEDESVGATFVGTKGVRQYLERYFLGYHTHTVILSLEQAGDAVVARVDFTGDFGHETGKLSFAFEPSGQVLAVEASLD